MVVRRPRESRMRELLTSKIVSKQALVGVIGLGYVGLPLIDAFVDAGFACLGFDIDDAKTQQLNAGSSYIAHVPSSRVSQWRDSGRFEATGDLFRLSEPDVIVICVPTPLTSDRKPDLSFVENTTVQIAATLRAGQLIVLESTTYPTTTRNVVLPLLERSGLKSGVDFFLAYSPEREDPGNATYRARTIPKVVGGIDKASLELAATLYEQAVVQVVPVSSCEVAEACKILENTYRAVNIALVNELKVLYDRMGIDVWEVIQAAKTKPFGFQPFYPGPGLGGHCIPIDPFYLTWIAEQYGLSTRFIELAGEVNASMPSYVVARTREALAAHGKQIERSRILLLGMAYKKDVDDPRESPGFELLKLFMAAGARVDYHDPYIPTLPRMRRYPNLHRASIELSPQTLMTYDCAVIVTDHSTYEYAAIVQSSNLVIDTRNATRCVDVQREKIVKA